MYLQVGTFKARFHVFILFFIFFQNFLFKFKFGYESSFIKSIDEFLIFSSSIVFLVARRDLVSSFFKFFNMFIFFYFSYLLVGLISSIFSSGIGLNTLYQLILDLKIISIIFVSYCLYVSGMTQIYFRTFLKAYLVLNLFFVIFQGAFSSNYDTLFDAELHTGGFYTSSGDVLFRFSAFMTHPGVLGMVSGFSAAYFLIFGKDKRESLIHFYFLIFLSLFFLIISLSRGEILSFLIGFFLYYFANKKIPRVYLFLFVLFLSFIFYMTFADFFQLIFKEIGLSYDSETISPRAVFLAKSIEIGNQNFPIGLGLGTFGGQAAVVFPSNVYYDYGFDQYFWFNLGLFLTDTYWPKILGETGFLGLLLLVFAFLSLAFRLKRRNKESNSGYLYYCLVAILINSLSSPSLNDSLYLMICFYIIGNVSELNRNA